MTSATAADVQRIASSVRTPTVRRLFVPLDAWPGVLYWCALSTLFLAPLYVKDSLLVAAAIASTMFVIVHASHAARAVPWIPGFVALIGTLQWTITSWLAYHVLQDVPTMRMVVDAQTYFGYIVPALLAMIAGMYLPLWSVGSASVPTGPHPKVTVKQVRRMADTLIVLGLFMRMVVVPLTPVSVRFIVQLIGAAGYVGAFTALLADIPGWRWRVITYLLIEGFVDSFWGQYLELFLWMGYAALLYLYRFRVPRLRLMLLGGAGLSLIFAINIMKSSLRGELRSGGYDAVERAQMAASFTGDLLGEPDKLYSTNNIVYNIGRLNQGSIISMIMAWTPSREPFARGETVATAFHAALVPRLLDPDKYVAGRMLYERFTGSPLLNGTSINLSIPGEMYANYGVAGGWLACLVFGTAIGLLFRAFIKLARRSHLWWAWAPFVFFSVPVAETGFGEILNQVVKALVMMAFLVFIMPFWSRLLRLPTRRRSVNSVVEAPVATPQGT